MNKITFLATLTLIIFLAISPLLIVLYSFTVNAEEAKHPLFRKYTKDLEVIISP